MNLRIHRYLPFTRVEGPGDRACLWVQGCPIHCPGCAVPWTWPDEGGELVDVDEFIDRMLQGPKVEGVTFVGGEPFAQAAALARIGCRMHREGLSVVTFTGYVLEDIIQSQRADWLDLLSVTDLLIDGPYRSDLADSSRPWVGSSNQRYHFLTDRYRHLANDIDSIPNRLEVRLQRDGKVLVNGMASAQQLIEIFDSIAVTDRSNQAQCKVADGMTG